MLHIYTYSGQHLIRSVTDGVNNIEGLDRGIWYDLINPTPDEEKFVEACLGVSVPTRDEMQDIEPSARLYTESNAEFLTLTALVNLREHDPLKTPVTFVLRDKVLVTLRYAEPLPFALFEASATKPGARAYNTGEMVMIGLIEALIDRLAQILEWTGDELDAISREVFRSRDKSATRKARNLEALIEKIGNKGDMLTLVRESLVSILRLTTFHQTKEETKAARDVRQEMKILQRDASALGDHAGFLSNKVNFLLDATLGLINLEQNQIIKIFSVAAVVFLPPTLVASIYGMNFEHMPELAWQVGYPFAIGLMIASAVLPYLFFKRKGWL
ncbi:magnesium transporter [Devosia limi DSM 17137]|uniref:Magnesium transport protein CorA n=1 Tax=Devosia limi DSM 17137 TaxID=1121477 RepID=A0A0F5LY89_9HYPH|nr:magnesium/cobalt transporter CorA [Devosia limi]KKB86597.1 magnesium transporter [Devosia limi DSM 17137]SHF65697.1 magnesium transporter [Devosia limi DSM 17137]